ncbi:MAG: hypothetical protein ACRDI3_05715 [Actinomycetota bacterium]
MKVLSFIAVFAGLIVLIIVNAGSGRRALITGTSIAVVIVGLLLMAMVFAYFVTRPAL